MDRSVTARLRMLGWAARLIVLCTASLVLLVLTVTGAALVVVWVGIPVLVWSVRATRVLADRRRAMIGAFGAAPGSPYLRVPEGNLLAQVRALVADPATRRDARWLLVDGIAGLALAVVALVENILDLLFWWLPPWLATRAHARVDHALLDVSEKSRLALRVQQLTESRAETVDTQAAELRRIERDLHDGAQARLVSLGMSLALAEQQLAADPEAARALLGEARAASSDALAELRDLVRGIHPPVLADRGLVGAVQALALAAPVPVQVDVAFAGRLPAPVESAAYFALAEALTNVVKHAGATQVVLALRHDGDALRLVVDDDGSGGADPAAGTGLRGIARRLSAFDGALTITSPPGGPTRLAMVLPCPMLTTPEETPDSVRDAIKDVIPDGTDPCASSSPRTSPSSGTA